MYRNPLKTNFFKFYFIGKITKICDPTVSVVFSCSDPPLVMTYDFVIGLHSVWHVTKARAEVTALYKLLDSNAKMSGHRS